MAEAVSDWCYGRTHCHATLQKVENNHAAIHDLVGERDELKRKVADLQAIVDRADG